MRRESHDFSVADINRLEAFISASVADHTFSSRILANHSLRTNTRHSRNGSDSRPQDQSFRHDLASELSSVVQDSQSLTEPYDPLLEPHRPPSANALGSLQAMSSQDDVANSTQLISQSFYELILKKNRSAQQHHQSSQTDTAKTFERGDPGHVDITSSFVTRQDQPEDPLDPEPLDFSPVHTQTQLTQFPESQRFKTPAVAGKKRTYTGDIISTPAPARNPLAPEGQPSPDGFLGLSQAFAATQAASSPLTNGLPTGPRSDRPSPNIELQTRPASASTSSPLLRPIVDPRKLTTEPASRYVSVRQSQAERVRQGELGVFQAENAKDALEDDFDDEDSLVVRKRRLRVREQQARRELQNLSSPISHTEDLSTSSPTKPPQKHNPLVGNSIKESISALQTTDIVGENIAIASEAETEQDDSDRVDVRRSSQLLGNGEDDKENRSVLVPKTVSRPSCVTYHAEAHVDSSPSLRQMAHAAESTNVLAGTDIQSSEPFRIMDSQPSQSRSRAPDSASDTVNTRSGARDFVEEIPQLYDLRSSNQSQGQESRKAFRQEAINIITDIVRPEREAEQHQQTNTPVTESNPGKTRNSTISNTSFDDRTGPVTHRLRTSNPSSDYKRSTITTENGFYTAPTHIEYGTTMQSSEPSSPIRSTPPGQKRRRLLEISAEPSPCKSQSRLSFNAEAVLQLDEDEAIANLLESSPQAMKRPGNQSNSHRICLRNSNKTNLSLEKQPSHESDADYLTRSETAGKTITNSLNAVLDVSPEFSQEIVRPNQHSRSQQMMIEPEKQHELTAPSPIATRRDVFEITLSPDRPITQRLKSTEMPAIVEEKRRRRKAVSSRLSRMDERLQAKTADASMPGIRLMTPDVVHARQLPLEQRTQEHDMKHNTLQDAVIAPHMVFAYYKGDPRGYYPAKLLKNINKSYYVKWEGYDPVEIDANGIKALDLRVGDAVKILADGFARIPYVIQRFKDKNLGLSESITDIRGYQTLIVGAKKRQSSAIDADEGLEFEVSIGSIYLDINMWAQLRFRDHVLKPLGTSGTISGVATPSCQSSTPGTPSSRGRRQGLATHPVNVLPRKGLFASMAFAISYDDAVQRNEMSELVQANGAMIIPDSFHDLLDESTLTLRPEYADIGFTALLTDKHSRKEKYMQALALGLPCLSGKWVQSCIRCETILEWQLYLLPAGESAELNNATRSRVLPPIDANNTKLRTLLDSRPNLLSSSAAIVVVGRGKTEAKRAPYVFLIRALGGVHIHKVPDLIAAKEMLDADQGKQYRWIFVDDKDVKSLEHMLRTEEITTKARARAKTKSKVEAVSSCKVAGNELIVQSLILGRLYNP